MQRVFKTRNFARWMRKTTLTYAVLCEAVIEMAAVQDGSLEEICHEP